MSDLHIRKIGHAGRVTLTRTKALNALSYKMALELERALDAWADDPEVKLVVIDAEGDKAFCAGGDIQELYDTAKAGNFDFGRRFWADEYRLNAKIAEYRKPYVALMQGFVMGGGVGISCHGSHRVVCESTQIAMPEVGIGLIPDVGGSLLLAGAPGRAGEYLGATAARMNAGDAIYAGFADTYIPREFWIDLITHLEDTGDLSMIDKMAETPPEGALPALAAEIDACFAGSPAEITAALAASESEFAAKSLKALERNSPISVAAALQIIRDARAAGNIRAALDLEYRFTYRSAEFGDFIEGIRAQIIDKDRNPKWRHARLSDVTKADVTQMTAPLDGVELAF